MPLYVQERRPPVHLKPHEMPNDLLMQAEAQARQLENQAAQDDHDLVAAQRKASRNP